VPYFFISKTKKNEIQIHEGAFNWSQIVFFLSLYRVCDVPSDFQSRPQKKKKTRKSRGSHVKRFFAPIFRCYSASMDSCSSAPSSTTSASCALPSSSSAHGLERLRAQVESQVEDHASRSCLCNLILAQLRRFLPCPCRFRKESFVKEATCWQVKYVDRWSELNPIVTMPLGSSAVTSLSCSFVFFFEYQDREFTHSGLTRLFHEEFQVHAPRHSRHASVPNPWHALHLKTSPSKDVFLPLETVLPMSVRALHVPDVLEWLWAIHKHDFLSQGEPLFGHLLTVTHSEPQEPLVNSKIERLLLSDVPRFSVTEIPDSPPPPRYSQQDPASEFLMSLAEKPGFMPRKRRPDSNSPKVPKAQKVPKMPKEPKESKEPKVTRRSTDDSAYDSALKISMPTDQESNFAISSAAPFPFCGTEPFVLPSQPECPDQNSLAALLDTHFCVPPLDLPDLQDSFLQDYSPVMVPFPTLQIPDQFLMNQNSESNFPETFPS